MRHRYLCPLRWSDLDLLGHVNNVRYADYLQEARGALLRSCLAAAGMEREEGDAYVVVRHELTFVAPMPFGREPVAVESWVSEIRASSFTLDHEILHEREDGSRQVYLRARTVMAPFDAASSGPRRVTDVERSALAPYAADTGERSLPVVVDVPHEVASHYPIQVRFSDLDIYRHVNNVQYVEYFQEARIAMFGRLTEALKGFQRISVVVAQTDIEYVAPMVLRPEPYDSWTRVTRVGRKSMTVEAEIRDSTGAAAAGQVLARSRVVVVLFDVETQRSVAPPEGYREAILSAIGKPLPAG